MATLNVKNLPDALYRKLQARARRERRSVAQQVTQLLSEALDAPKARDVIEQVLFGAARMASDPRLPAGCLMVQGALACGDSAGSVQKETAARRAASEIALRRRLQRAKREGDLPRNANPGELASYVMTVLQGMAVQGANGARRNQLRRIAQIALRAWPKG